MSSQSITNNLKAQNSIGTQAQINRPPSPTTFSSPHLPQSATSGPAPIAITALTDISSTSQVDRAAQGIIMPPRPELDPGIIVALNYFKTAIANKARLGDLYSRLLEQLISQNSETQAIEWVKNLKASTLKSFLKGEIIIATHDHKSIMMDALRLTALQGNFSLLRFLLTKTQELNLPQTKDRCGWCLAHIVALHAQGSTQLATIPELQSQQNLGNNSGSTPQDFVFWLSEPPQVSVSAFGAQHPPLSPDEFFKHTGSHYWNRSRFTPGALLRFAFEDLKTPDGPPYLSSFLGPKITTYIDTLCDQPCKLTIKKMQGPQVPQQLKGQWECLTSQNVAKGDVLALYTGTVMQLIWRRETDIGGKSLCFSKGFWTDSDIGGGSLAQFINHGFPNCAFFFHMYHGLPMMAVIAIENLSAGVPLFLNYGAGYFKGNEITPLNLNPSGITSFLAVTKDLKHISQALSPDGTTLFYSENGKTLEKNLLKPASESEATDAWANFIRLEYLANYQAEDMENRLEKLPYRWLINEFAKKS